MVLGDSYIKGIGINKNNQFSNILFDTLKQLIPHNKEPIVLNLSNPGNSFLDNYLLFYKYFDQFKPHTILWSHTLNDLEPINDFKIKDIQRQYNSPQKELEIKSKTLEKRWFELKKHDRRSLKVDNLTNINELNHSIESQIKSKRSNLNSQLNIYLNKSEIIRYIKYNIQSKLLRTGIKLPYNEFYHLTEFAYLNNSIEFRLFKKLFDEINATIIIAKVNLIFYSMPTFNLIHKPHFFQIPEKELKKTFTNREKVTFINGRLDFLKYTPDELTSMPTNGHPNKKAHKILVKSILDILKSIDSKFFIVK